MNGFGYSFESMSEMSLLHHLLNRTKWSPHYSVTSHVHVMINEWNQRHLWEWPHNSARRTAAQMQGSIYLPNAPFNSLPDR